MNEPFAFYQQSADYVRARMPFEPQIAVILGSSLGPFAGQLQDPVEIDYHEIPNFLTSTAPGHAGKLIFGTLAGKRLVCLSGRFHSYEGYDFEQLTQPVRLLKLLGVRALIVTNAAGGVNERYRPGDFMLIADQIKLNGASPLRGRNVDEFGPRFFDVTRMYTPELRALAKTCADELGIRVQEGVYFFMPGPQFETPAEIRAIRALGGDAVGMSTVTEALTAAHCGLPLLGISVITNLAAGMTGAAVTGEEVNETGAAVAGRFSRYLTKIVEEMDVLQRLSGPTRALLSCCSMRMSPGTTRARCGSWTAACIRQRPNSSPAGRTARSRRRSATWSRRAPDRTPQPPWAWRWRPMNAAKKRRRSSSPSSPQRTGRSRTPGRPRPSA